MREVLLRSRDTSRRAVTCAATRCVLVFDWCHRLTLMFGGGELTLRPLLPDNTLAQWDRVSASCRREASVALPVPRMLIPLTEPQSVDPVFGLVYMVKAGSGTMSHLVSNFAIASRWRASTEGAKARNKSAKFAHERTQLYRSQLRIVAGSDTLSILHLTGRPGLVITTLREPVDRAISLYNYNCVCNIEHKSRSANCTDAFTDYAKLEATTLINTLLRVSGDERERGGGSLAFQAQRCFESASSETSTGLESLLLELLQAQLMAPCVSVLPLHELERSLPLLNARLHPHNLSLLESAPQVNSLATHNCSERSKSSGRCQNCPTERMAMLLNPRDRAVRAAMQRQAAAQSVVRVSHRLWEWFDRSKEDLLRRRAVPCEASLRGEKVFHLLSAPPSIDRFPDRLSILPPRDEIIPSAWEMEMRSEGEGEI